jgi:hypothetical protein
LISVVYIIGFRVLHLGWFKMMFLVFNGGYLHEKLVGKVSIIEVRRNFILSP